MAVALADRADVRAFGAEAHDLDVDFGCAARASVVSAVLERCAGAGASAWALPVGDRIGALVRICGRSGQRELSWILACPAAGCGEEIEIELPLAALADATRTAAAETAAEVRWDGATFRPRRPTGDDLRRWRAEPPSGAGMVEALGGPPLAPPELVAAVEDALAAVDPLVDARVRSACPACGHEIDFPVDVEGEVVATLRRAQDELLLDVATLARAFHWSEQEILGLPVHRRRRYLSMVEREEP
jgi:hypothetical protein